MSSYIPAPAAFIAWDKARQRILDPRRAAGAVRSTSNHSAQDRHVVAEVLERIDPADWGLLVQGLRLDAAARYQKETER